MWYNNTNGVQQHNTLVGWYCGFLVHLGVNYYNVTVILCRSNRINFCGNTTLNYTIAVL